MYIIIIILILYTRPGQTRLPSLIINNAGAEIVRLTMGAVSVRGEVYPSYPVAI